MKTENKIEGTQKSLEGELTISNFPNLEKVFLPQNKITQLIIKDCPRIKEINVYDNQLIKLEITSLPELEYLHCGNNKLKELNVSENTKLRTLFYFNNPFESQLENLIGKEKLVNLEGFRGKGLIKELSELIEIERTIHQDIMKATDNFYRQNPPSEDIKLINILQAISNSYLVINRENRQREQEIKELKEIINNLENLVIRSEDSFLVQKIENKRNQLEQLKINLRNDLNGNWHETLEDVLEVKKAFIQSNNESTLNQLRKFKQRLLNSGQVNENKLNKLCQIQAELSFLELKLEQEQVFQAQIEINQQ